MFLGPAGGVPAAGPEGSITLDCGVNALYLMHQLEGHPVTLDRLESWLPARQRDGCSMAELAAASRSLGLALEGVRFAEGDAPPDRNAIVFLKDARAGHFAVLRPVGTTRTMVQVIDPPSAPRSPITIASGRRAPGRAAPSSLANLGPFNPPSPRR